MDRIAHVLVCHSFIPSKLFESIPHDPSAVWLVFLHGTSEEVSAHAASAVRERNGHLFAYRTNRGLSRSWNDALALARDLGCFWTLLLNDDLFFYKDAYIEFCQTIKTVRSLSNNVSHVTLNGLESGASAFAGQVIAQNFACCAITRDAQDKIGFFDENFFPAYYEDIDFARRAAIAGMTVHVDPRVLVEHERSSTTRLVSAEQRRIIEHDFRNNQDYFTRKWGSEHGIFHRPFDRDGFNLTIGAQNRHAPYGAGFDREDLHRNL